MIIVYLADRDSELTHTSKELCKKTIVYGLEILMYLIFGILFYDFQKNPDKFDYCTQEQIREWSKATAIICFVYIGMCFLRITSLLYFKSEYRFVRWIVLAAFLIRVVLSIGLNKHDNSDCGHLHKVAICFYVFHYIVFTLIFGFLVIILIHFLNR